MVVLFLSAGRYIQTDILINILHSGQCYCRGSYFAVQLSNWDTPSCRQADQSPGFESFFFFQTNPDALNPAGNAEAVPPTLPEI